MKQTKMYEAPKAEVIKVELQGFLCASAPEATYQFDGVVMEFNNNEGAWVQ